MSKAASASGGFSRDASDYSASDAHDRRRRDERGVPLRAIASVIEDGKLAPEVDQRDDTVKLKGRYRGVWYYVVIDPDRNAVVTSGICG